MYRIWLKDFRDPSLRRPLKHPQQLERHDHAYLLHASGKQVCFCSICLHRLPGKRLTGRVGGLPSVHVSEGLLLMTTRHSISASSTHGQAQQASMVLPNLGMSAATRAGKWLGWVPLASLAACAISYLGDNPGHACSSARGGSFTRGDAGSVPNLNRLGLLTSPKLWQTPSDLRYVQVHSSDMPEIWNMLKITTLALVIAVCSAGAVIILLVIGSPTIVNGYADCKTPIIATSTYLRASDRSG